MKFEIGQKIWFKEYWSEVIMSAHITDIFTDDRCNKTFAKVTSQKDDTSIGTFTIELDNLYESEDIAIQTEKEKFNNIVNKYKADIISEKDLIVFMFNNTINGGEYTDYAARQAVIDKAKELFDLDLN